MITTGDFQGKSSHVFIGSNITLGLIPSGAQLGDFIYQFWNSRAAAFVRKANPNTWEGCGKSSCCENR